MGTEKIATEINMSLMPSVLLFCGTIITSNRFAAIKIRAVELEKITDRLLDSRSFSFTPISINFFNKGMMLGIKYTEQTYQEIAIHGWQFTYNWKM
jgi:hypothetical protein